jgi:putative endonuclease
VTNNLKVRVRQHEKARGTAKSFTGKYYCYKLIYYEIFETPSDAIAREKEIKNFTHEKKMALIKKVNPRLDFYRV